MTTMTPIADAMSPPIFPRRKGMFGRGLSDYATSSENVGRSSRAVMPGSSAGLNADADFNPSLAAPSFVANTDGGPQIFEGVIPQLPKQRGSGFNWQRAAGIVGDALSGMVGQPPIYAHSQIAKHAQEREAAMQRAKMQREEAIRMQDRQWSLDDQAAERAAPQYFMSGGDRVRFDPATGQSAPVYNAPEPFEEYAATLGLDPGTPEYTKAVQDYVLKSSGPTAYGYDQQLDDYRTNNDIRSKGAPTYRQANPAPPRPSRPRAPASPRLSKSSGARTATNPQTGQTVTFNSATGRWE